MVPNVSSAQTVQEEEEEDEEEEEEKTVLKHSRTSKI